MRLTLIITTYNWPEALLLVIESIRLQTVKPDEVIIADDGSSKETEDLIKGFNIDDDFNIIHSWQEDKGFRAARSRNMAISKSTGEYIVLIDGDTLLHADFVKDHILNAQHGFFVQGSRVLISESQTKKTLLNKKINFSFFSSEFSNKKNAIHSKVLAIFFSRKKNHLNGIKSCNMGFYRKDCIKINGFNNDFEGWGREDSEFVVRLMNSGINRKNIYFNAIQYHLWHYENSRNTLVKNDAILKNAIENRLSWCNDGINCIEYES